MKILLPFLGASLLVLLAVDVFFTVFHASGRGGPVNRRINRGLWSAFRFLGARRGGAPRDRLLALAGPSIVISTLLVWMGLLVFGCFLVYLVHFSGFRFSPAASRTPWAEAMYYSLYTASTLGLGDMVADPEWLRLFTGIQAVSGFALTTVAITYLLSVYAQVAASRTLASQISGYFADGVEATLRRVEASEADALPRWAEDITAPLLAILQAQYQYPVLSYFRPLDESRSLPVQLGCLWEAASRVTSAASTRETIGRHPSVAALVRALERYFSEVEQNFLPRECSPAGPDDGADRVRATQQCLVRYLGYPPAP